MAKAPKSGSSRKPPLPSESHAEIDDWSRRVMPDLRPIVTALDEVIRRTIPGLHFAVKWRKAHYGLPDRGWIIELTAYDVSVNIVFFGGADFDSPPPLGTTGVARYVKLKSLDEARAPEIRSWIEQAKDHPGWR